MHCQWHVGYLQRRTLQNTHEHPITTFDHPRCSSRELLCVAFSAFTLMSTAFCCLERTPLKRGWLSLLYHTCPAYLPHIFRHG